MALRNICIIFATLMLSYVESCMVSISPDTCSYTVTCTGILQGLNWRRFMQRPDSPPSYEMCMATTSYGGYALYPVDFTYKQTETESPSTIPVFYDWSEGQAICHISRSFDISDNGYTEAPAIRSMPNLAVLNMSRNHLTVAELSNIHELSSLTEIDLSHNTIKNIKIDTYPSSYTRLKKINLSHNYLVTIPNAIFDTIDDLQTLDLSNNYIDSLSQLTFEGIKKLSDLNLANNRLRSLNSSLFRFSELKFLNLSGNRIDDLKSNDFDQLVQLETLDLSANLIKTIKDNIFNTMAYLTNLDLNNNLLESINKNAFSSLRALTKIDLTNNKLKSLPRGLFQNNNLLFFSIGDNRLEGALSRGMFDGVNGTKIDLSHQSISEVQDFTFHDLINLKTLLLNFNSIRSLSTMCFKTLNNLEVLNLSDNLITNLDFEKEDLGNLYELLLKNNRLTEIKQEQLQYLNNLQFLDLSQNQITHLAPKSFESLRNLVNLELNNNPFVGTLATGTFDGLVLLPSLDISHNMLTTVQNASFSDMNQLKDLNMSHCDINVLQYNAFIETGYIEILDLSYNKLSGFFVNSSHLVGLSKLFLDNNLIKTISTDSLHGLSVLVKITLSHNVLESIDDDAFKSLIDLRHLDLSYNEELSFNIAALDKNINLNTLILSGIVNTINFSHIIEDNPISEMIISNASIENISELNLGGMRHLESLDLSRNNISKLQIGDFTNVTNLRALDLSFNKISYIQPGVFKDTTQLYFLNISHNDLSSVSYGIFRGLIYLAILDMSYNNIEDLQSERFYEVKSLTQLIVDYNKIDSLNAAEFVGTSLSKLSIGGNPLSCQVLVKLQRNGVPYTITAIVLDEHNDENVNGVTCNRANRNELPVIPKDNEGSKSVLIGLRNILYNLTSRNIDQTSTDVEYLGKISNVLEEKLTNLVNLTHAAMVVNNNTNMMLDKLIQSLDQTTAVPATTSVAPNVKTVTSPITSTSTTLAPIIRNSSNVNDTLDVVPYIDKIKEELKKTIAIEKENIIKEIENKFSLNTHQTELIPTGVGHEKLVSNNESTKSLFTETCVALILLILVGLILYKFYKSRIYIRNRFSISTRELPGAMENSTL